MDLVDAKDRTYFIKLIKIAVSAFILLTISILILVQLFLSSKNRPIGAWGILHYYINAKYFKELGYFNLYSCTIATNAKNLKGVSDIRDLNSYQIVNYKSTLACPKDKFTKKRWIEFSSDVKTITDNAPNSYWALALTDKGYNPTPFWTTIAGFVANLISIEDRFNYLILFNIDIVFVTITGLISGIFLKRKSILIVLLFIYFYFGSFLQITNNYFQYIWFPFIAISYIFWQLKKPTISGVSLGLASALQAFPSVFAIAIFIIFIKYRFFIKKTNYYRLSSLFLVSFVATLVSCILISSLYFNGFNNWTEWYKKISSHKNYINFEIFNIGFPNLYNTLISSDKIESIDYKGDSAHVFYRMSKSNSSNLLVLNTILVLFVSIFALKIKPTKIFGLGYIFVYLLLSMSAYYFIIIALIPLIFGNYSKKVWNNLIIGIFILFTLHILVFSHGYNNFSHIKHLISELSIAAFFAFVLFAIYYEQKQGKN